MSQKKSKEKPIVKDAIGNSSATSGDAEVFKDFNDFGKILKVDLSNQDEQFEYALYAQLTVVQK